MKYSALPAALLLILAGPAAAQSADSFKTSDLVTPEPAAGSMESAPDTANPLLTQPSRYAGIELENYVRVITSSFSMRGRAVDPFGRDQDPNAKPIVPKRTNSTIPTYKPAPVTPFPDIIAAIQVTTIIPAQRTFLVGQRSFSVGDRIKLNTEEGKIIPVLVVAVRSNAITFRNETTSETADLKLDLVPDGMSRGNNVRPPGVVPAGGNAPLDIGPTASISSSR